MKLSKNFFYFRGIDWLLFWPVFLLSLIGLVVIYSLIINNVNLDYSRFYKQLFFVVSGLIIFFVLSFIDYRSVRSYVWLWYFLALILLFGLIFFGRNIRGTTGWYTFGIFNFQPAELLKPILALTLAHFLSVTKRKELSLVIASGIVYFLPVILIILQPDFGVALVFIFLWLAIIFLKKISLKSWLVIILLILILSLVSWQFALKNYQKERFLNFFSSDYDVRGSGYNLRQSILAIGSGEFLGRGLGLGPQSQLKFLPEAQTDFIFAVIAEELGFLGSMIIFALYLFLFSRMARIVKNSRDDFTFYFSFSLSFLIIMQTLVNLGMNMGLMPITGLPLPFISYGGSALLSLFIMVGLLESIAMRQKVVL